MTSGGDEILSSGMKAAFGVAVVVLVAGSGLMSGLTLGYLSLDKLDLEVLRRTGNAKEQHRAGRVLPVVRHAHWLLCTLVLVNCCCVEALPIFLDRLLDPISAVLLSVTAILIFGEILPQAVCSRHSVAIGSFFAPFVRVLMWVCCPISWPFGRVLDRALGHEDPLMKRTELKAMVDLHGETGGMGGTLSLDEINVISGALEMTSKTAAKAMTPMDKVTMIRDTDTLTDALVRRLLQTGHSRFPVYRGGDPSDVVGIMLIKDLLHYWQCQGEPPQVRDLRLRPLPAIPVDTPMFDVLNLFQTGRAHMALLLSRAPTAMAGRDAAVHLTATGGAACAAPGASGGGGGEAVAPHVAVVVAPEGGAAHSSTTTAGGATAEVELLSLDAGGNGGSSDGSAADSPVRRSSWLGRQVSRVRSLGSRQTRRDIESAAFVAGALPSDGEAPTAAGAAGAAGDGADAGGDGADGAGAGEGGGGGSSEAAGEESRPVGIITLEDVIEELMQEEIVDETDRWVDNNRTEQVDVKALVGSLPPRVRKLLQAHMWEAANLLARHSGGREESALLSAAAALGHCANAPAPSVPAPAAAAPRVGGAGAPLKRSASERALESFGAAAAARRHAAAPPPTGHQRPATSTDLPPRAAAAAGGRGGGAAVLAAEVAAAEVAAAEVAALRGASPPRAGGRPTARRSGVGGVGGGGGGSGGGGGGDAMPRSSSEPRRLGDAAAAAPPCSSLL